MIKMRQSSNGRFVFKCKKCGQIYKVTKIRKTETTHMAKHRIKCFGIKSTFETAWETNREVFAEKIRQLLAQDLAVFNVQLVEIMIS